MSAKKHDYYDILAVSRNASDDEIKKAYRRMAMKYHPDRNKGDTDAEVKFKEAKEAYEVLSDSQKRTLYDQFGHEGLAAASARGAPSGATGFGNFGDIFEDLFGDVFGGRRGGQQARMQRGADLRYTLEVSLEDAVFGKAIKINVPTLAHCKTCEGSGAKKGSGPTTCTECQGSGHIRLQQGFFAVQQTCPHCHGSGQVIKDPCIKCHGHGRIKEKTTLSVKIPSGVDSGDRIRLAGKGEAGPKGAQPGDLYVQIHVKQHDIFSRDGQHLHCKVPISFTTAAIGGEIEIPTLEGRIKLKIPSETQTGKQFRLRGKGIQEIRGSTRGDLFCHAIVETPIRLNKEQKEMLQSFDKSLKIDKKDHSPRTTSWFDGVRRFFESMKS